MNFSNPRVKAKYWRLRVDEGVIFFSLFIVSWAKFLKVTGAVPGAERETGTSKVYYYYAKFSSPE